jgi:rubrerythrin
MTATQPRGEQITGVKDKNYNLISAVYHMLDAATNYETYIQDAQKDGDEELADFFRKLQEQTVKYSQEGEKLLASRLNK